MLQHCSRGFQVMLAACRSSMHSLAPNACTRRVFGFCCFANVLDEPCSIQQISLSLAFLGAAQLVFQVSWPMLFSSFLFQHNCGWNILDKQGPHRSEAHTQLVKPLQFDGIINVPSFNCTIIAIIRMTQFFAGLIILADNTFCQLISRQETAGSLSLLSPSRSTARNGLPLVGHNVWKHKLSNLTTYWLNKKT